VTDFSGLSYRYDSTNGMSTGSDESSQGLTCNTHTTLAVGSGLIGRARADSRDHAHGVSRRSSRGASSRRGYSRRLVEAHARGEAALNSVTLDSTGDMSRQQTYTLTTGEDTIDLSKKNLGPADVALVATWLQRPEVMAAVTSVGVSTD